jgi:hypothetical protein
MKKKKTANIWFFPNKLERKYVKMAAILCFGVCHCEPVHHAMFN